MWILPLVGYAGALLGFCFLTLAIASGLYYLSELVEEHSVVAKRFLTRLIYTIIVVQVFLWLVDGFPFWLSLFSIATHVVYLGNMRRFPFVKLSDPLFVLSCILVLANHWVWFRHFSHTQARSYARSTYYDNVDVPSFTMIASYFGLCVWLVPFSLFVSLSAGDNVLPTMGTEPARGIDGKAKPQGMVKALVDNIRGALSDVLGSSSSQGIGRP